MNNFYAPTIKKWIMRAMLAFVVVVAAVYIYWSFAPYDNIITYKLGSDGNSANYVMSKGSYAQGETGHYHIDYCKYTDVRPTVERYYVDGLRIQASDNRTVLKMGCNIQGLNFTIPKSLPPGRWHLEVTACYQVNPVRKPICYTNRSDWFTVTRAEVGAYGQEE